MEPLVNAIRETAESPDAVVQSNTNRNARLHYREYIGAHAGDKQVCVVVIMLEDDAFIASTYLREQVREGLVLWKAQE